MSWTHPQVAAIQSKEAAIARVLDKFDKKNGHDPNAPCTFIKGGAIDVAPAPQKCLIASGHTQTLGRIFRKDITADCNATPKSLPRGFSPVSGTGCVIRCRHPDELGTP